MKRTLASLLSLAFGCIFSAYAQNSNSLLWEISGKDLETPSYLFGTIHLMCPQDIKITPAMQEALSASERLVLEIDMDEPGVMQKMQSASIMQDGSTLKSLLSEKDYQFLEQYLKDSLSIPIQAVNAMNPMMLSTVLMLPVLDCQPGSYEMSLVKQAQEKEMEVYGLETIEDQVAIFNAIPLDKQSEYLMSSIREHERSVKEIKALLSAYHSENIDALYKLVHDSMKPMEGAEKVMLDDRNNKWLPQITEMSQEGATFFAVGAGHLSGPQGVIELLREKGYQLKPIQ
ncbi:TraB/GumN family protein [Porifericola rhodea]|uniref:TraB/GumN family protein n=1 Tax=Porifericola rhodea TaxID=930972 RepID=UPI00266553C2|nr:TraB/GumN family protein [Porifericola rhodea]WKN32745.1 TraB/GumN family protein [Porifericola rhodea]